MNAVDFVAAWAREKDGLLAAVRTGQTAAGQRLLALGLDEAQSAELWATLDEVLRAAFYTLLLGLDGAAAIGGVQHAYRLYVEDDTPISACGELEAAAWERFHGEA